MKLQHLINLLNIYPNKDAEVYLFDTKTGARIKIHSIDLDSSEGIDINFQGK